MHLFIGEMLNAYSSQLHHINSRGQNHRQTLRVELPAVRHRVKLVEPNRPEDELAMQLPALLPCLFHKLEFVKFGVMMRALGG